MDDGLVRSRPAPGAGGGPWCGDRPSGGDRGRTRRGRLGAGAGRADGYQDSADGSASPVDALYYTTVTLSTTGYGHITPVTTAARLTNALLVTPMRFLFVLVLVGTTIQVLTERSRDQFRVACWRSCVQDHDAVMREAEVGKARAVVVAVSRDDTAVLTTLTIRQLAPEATVALRCASRRTPTC